MLSAPTATPALTDVTTAGGMAQTFTVTYQDLGGQGVDVSTLDGNDIQITGPNGYSQFASLVSVDNPANGSPRTATYSMPAPGGLFDLSDNGAYSLALQSHAVADTLGEGNAPASLGVINVNIPDMPPTAELAASPLTTAGNTTYAFFVVFSDDDSVDVSTIGTGAVRVTGPNGFDQLATFFTLTEPSNGSPRSAVFTIEGSPTFEIADNGAYSVSLLGGHVADTSGHYAAAADLGTFSIAIPDTQTPTVSANSLDTLPSFGDTSYTFTVTFDDNVAIDVSTLGTGDVRVSGPRSFIATPTFIGVNVDSDGRPRAATYRFTAPGGDFNAGDNGVYTFTLQTDEVADTSGNVAAAGIIGSFTLNLDDLTKPTASVLVSNITTVDVKTRQFTVTYTDDVAVDVTSLDSFDLLVTGPHGYSQHAKLESVNGWLNGPSVEITYSFSSVGDAFTFADNGTYTISIVASQVADTSGNYANAGALGAVSVAVPDVIVPTAAVGLLSSITAATTDPYTFTVTYSDNDAVKLASLDNGDIRVTGPNGFSQLATFVSADQETNTSPLVVTYRISGPGGSFVSANSGTYTLSVVADQVKDLYDNAVAAGDLGTFTVTIPDTTVPTWSTLTIADVRAGGGANTTFTVIFADDVAIDLASLGNTDIRVTGPNGFDQLATFVSVNNSVNGTPRTATYRIAAPGGTFDKLDNGLYTLALQADQVADATGNFVAAATLGAFRVDIPEVFGNVDGRNVKLTLADPDGTFVTFTLKGNGSGAVRVGEAGFLVELTGTDSKSSVSLTTQKPSNTPDADKYAILESLRVGSATDSSNADNLGSFSASNATLAGAFVVNGVIDKLTLGTLNGSAGIQILDRRKTTTPATSVTLGTVNDGAIDSKVIIKNLTVAAWNDTATDADLITAPGIGKLVSRGNFNADVTLTSGTTTALSSLSVTGSMTGSNFRVAGSVGTVSVGAMVNSNFFAGVATGATTLPVSSQLISVQTVKSFVVRGLAGQQPAFVNSNVAASFFQTIRLVRVDTDNDGTALGVTADSVTNYTRDNVRLSKRVQAAELDHVDDFRLRIV